ncbi:MAG: NAD(P)-dependent dehydrogenase (short-subunit alcohol dehydrogenase family) [Glaciecola sp.]|jgi:NAD(P)-dependent dehydrogenase (short-subunit alcohol dehydrogenase family)|uniref:YciK family oxidoreductase n=1 Tax=Congregibacter sp. TaxID=2744308 RepID=UPI0039E65E00
MSDQQMVGIGIPPDYQPAANALLGKTILVTGASDGIGRSAALSFAAHGATVILLARNVEKLEAVYDLIDAAGGPQPAAIPFDLAQDNEEAFIELARVIEEQLGKLDGMLLNASILGQRRALEQSAWNDWRDVLQLNVHSQFLTAKCLMPLLREAPRASVVFTSSGVGRTGRAYWGAYAVSKFATEGMMQVLASETENTSNVRVNCINPGATNTAMRRNAYPAEEPSSNPSPDAIMRSYLYLMDDASTGKTGYSFNAQ